MDTRTVSALQSPYEVMREARADMMSGHKTPCEIIREARADLMGARPVPTSRPFTPKERERVLFGEGKTGARPPSAVNLSYLRKTESGVVKLPTILPSLSGRKTRQPLTSQAVSLDNLVEEVFDSDREKFSGESFRLEPCIMRKSYSSPQERLTGSPLVPSVSSNKWVGVPKQLSDPIAPILPPQRKKVHRLRSIQTRSNESEENSSQDLETVRNGSRVEDDPRNDSVAVPAPQSELSEETSHGSLSARHSGGEIERIEIPPESTTSEMMEYDVNLNTVVNEEERSVFENPDGDDLVAVLSNGKLVWEPPRPKEERPAIVEAVKSAPQRQERNIDAMRKHLVEMQSRMRDLSGNIDKLGERVSRGANQRCSGDGERVFYMNDNKRYHTSNNAEKGSKTYMKYSASAEEPEEPRKSAVKQASAGWDFFWKNSYYRTREEPLRPELQALIPTLDELDDDEEITPDDERLTRAEELIDSLYSSLKAVDGFSPGWLSAQFTTKLLVTLYKYAELDRPKLLLLIARILLAVRVDSCLAVSCKMIFKVCRSDNNDVLFLQIPDILELFLDGIGRTSPLDSAENCIYGYGALKFLTANSNSVVLAQAVHLGAVDLIALHLKMVNSSQPNDSKINEQTQQAIFQLTAALRNIADGPGVGNIFLSTNCLLTLGKTLELYRGDEEIVTNITRTLSSLSSDESVGVALAETSELNLLLVDLLSQYRDKPQIVIRLAYTLGNLLASSDGARIQVSRHAPSLNTLLDVLQLHVGRQVSTAEERQVLDDVIVKVVRVLANMAINGMVGGVLSSDARLAAALQVIIKAEGGLCDAVLLAALGCLNNLSYYVQPHSPFWLQLTKDVAAMLASSFDGKSTEMAVQACRVLGNLTRHKPSRDLLYSFGGVDTLGMMVEWGSSSVVRSVCGVLVNMLLDERVRQHFLENQGIHRLLEALERFQGDWVLAGLVCRAIWNACAPDISLAAELIHMDIDRLLTTLANCLEEENWTDGDLEWEEFAGVATDLLERFNSHLEKDSPA